MFAEAAWHATFRPLFPARLARVLFAAVRPNGSYYSLPRPPCRAVIRPLTAPPYVDRDTSKGAILAEWPLPRTYEVAFEPAANGSSPPFVSEIGIFRSEGLCERLLLTNSTQYGASKIYGSRNPIAEPTTLSQYI